jgi:para-aminobenzoate synthetase / 4-amino-4-deoxychorismate lyase
VTPINRPIPTVILQAGRQWWRFCEPVQIFTAKHVSEVQPAMEQIAKAVEEDSLYAAGYLSYEAAGAYGLPTRVPTAGGPPILWFGLFNHREEVPPPSGGGSYTFGEWRPSLDPETYFAAISRIKEVIAAGYTYQANFTFHLRAGFAGDPWALFSALYAAQRSHYCAYFDLGRIVVCSASPELFFSLDGDRLESRPMKGTAARGLTLSADQVQIDWLKESEKNRAENVMIVDMIRNDFGRIAATGSVRVPELFTIERYPTLLQMTSTVTARSEAPLPEILAAMFPCASITGAPKMRTMAILRDLEKEPRGLYTGAIGFIAPGHQAQFNVAIRTVVIDQDAGEVTYGVGSGVVWDSDAATEYAECLLKARVLDVDSRPLQDLQLLETLRWTSEQGFFLLDLHLRRLSDSAEYFDFVFDEAEIRHLLEQLTDDLSSDSKVRLLLSRDGQIKLETVPIDLKRQHKPLRVGLALQPVSSTNVWLYHKTTRRDVYEQVRASRPECEEVILWNERGELTEATTSNIVVELGGRLVTPPISSGLLAGTYRAHMLDKGDVIEQVIRVEELSEATGLWLINSVRGRRQAVLVISEPDDRR